MLKYALSLFYLLEYLTTLQNGGDETTKQYFFGTFDHGEGDNHRYTKECVDFDLQRSDNRQRPGMTGRFVLLTKKITSNVLAS